MVGGLNLSIASGASLPALTPLQLPSQLVEIELVNQLVADAQITPSKDPNRGVPPPWGDWIF